MSDPIEILFHAECALIELCDAGLPIEDEMLADDALAAIREHDKTNDDVDAYTAAQECLQVFDAIDDDTHADVVNDLVRFVNECTHV